MSKKEMKLALDALNLVNLEFVCDGAHHAKKDRHELGDDCPVTARYQLAIKALEEALAKQEQSEPAFYVHDGYLMTPERAKFLGFPLDSILALYTTPPHSFFEDVADDLRVEIAELQDHVRLLEKQLAQQKQGEPVAWNLKDVTDAYKLGAKSQQRTWVGLTDEELEPLCKEWRILFGSWTQEFARAIEAKLKEKNT